MPRVLQDRYGQSPGVCVGRLKHTHNCLLGASDTVSAPQNKVSSWSPRGWSAGEMKQGCPWLWVRELRGHSHTSVTDPLDWSRPLSLRSAHRGRTIFLPLIKSNPRGMTLSWCSEKAEFSFGSLSSFHHFPQYLSCHIALLRYWPHLVLQKGCELVPPATMCSNTQTQQASISYRLALFATQLLFQCHTPKVITETLQSCPLPSSNVQGHSPRHCKPSSSSREKSGLNLLLVIDRKSTMLMLSSVFLSGSGDWVCKGYRVHQTAQARLFEGLTFSGFL